MPRRPQPVPPIFQPEVAADAIVWAATHRRRELCVGWRTVKTIWGDKMAPGLLDHYLARMGYDAQQTDEPAIPDRLDNLMSAVPGDHGAHGRFGERSRSFSWQLWATMHRSLVLGSLAGVAGLLWSVGVADATNLAATPTSESRCGGLSTRSTRGLRRRPIS